MTTQLMDARAGIVTEAMRQVAESEGVDVQTVRDEVAAGRLVIPANEARLRSNLRPVGIGRALRTKVNANIGTSSVRCSVEAEIEKMRAALAVGADAMMDLSTGGDLDAIRAELLAHCPVPFGTVPIYQVIEGRQRRGCHAGTHPANGRKAGPAGRRFLHHPRGRPPRASAPARKAGHGHRQPGRGPAGQVDAPLQPPEPAVRDVRRPVRPHGRARRVLLAGRRPASRRDRRRDRRGPARGAAHAGRADPAGLGAGLPGHGRRSRPRPVQPDPVQHGDPAAALPRGPLLRAGPAW
jgi:hypothetical protein